MPEFWLNKCLVALTKLRIAEIDASYSSFLNRLPHQSCFKVQSPNLPHGDTPMGMPTKSHHCSFRRSDWALFLITTWDPWNFLHNARDFSKFLNAGKMTVSDLCSKKSPASISNIFIFSHSQSLNTFDHLMKFPSTPRLLQKLFLLMVLIHFQW